MIEAFRVGAVLGGRTIWEGLDLAFDEGEVCVVTGGAGSGKTLLLRTLRGDRRPESGDVVAGGVSLYRGDRAAAASFRSSTGVVPESFHSAAGTRVMDLFFLSEAAGPRVPAGERAERRGELLSLVGLDGAQDRELSSLSLSERARVALAAELFRGPKRIFADMLASNAGTEWADMLGGLFRALAREGRTVIMAERTFPDRWKMRSGEEGIAKGPFRLYRLPVAREGAR